MVLKTGAQVFKIGGNKMNYEVSEGTLAIVPMKKSSSKVFEDDNEYVVDKVPFEIMDDSCRYFGSSYEGRKEGAKSILGVEYKVPIVVEDYNNLVFFPTISPQDPKCVWIASKQVKDYEELSSNSIRVTFENDTQIIVPVSYRSFQNQLLRATRLESLIRNRKKLQ